MRKSKKFTVILADPPWSFGDSLKMNRVKRGAASQYTVLNDASLQHLAPYIKRMSRSDGTILALWCCGSKLQEALLVMKAWGFQHKQTYCWVKTKKGAKTIDDSLAFGMGRLFRQTHEICLIGI